MAEAQQQRRQGSQDANGSGSKVAPAIVSRVHARVGLLGNPSDGFYGKTLSLSLANFYAEVRALKARAVWPLHAQPCGGVRRACGACRLETAASGTPGLAVAPYEPIPGPVGALPHKTAANHVPSSPRAADAPRLPRGARPPPAGSQVTLAPRPPGSGIEFLPHPQHDRTQYSGLSDLAARVESEGYYGGVRLLMVSE
jgi:hypothetical protein